MIYVLAASYLERFKIILQVATLVPKVTATLRCFAAKMKAFEDQKPIVHPVLRV